jgi:3-methyladenine DNA glycosylase/8-oxoguanine DNA glycosylase
MNHEEAHRHLSAGDKRLAALIARSHRYNIEPNLKVRPFDALAESIAYQQLSGKAAATIWKRVRAIFPKQKFLDPKLVLETPDEKLRAAGLSRSKVAALKDLAAKTIEGIVPTGRALAKMTDDEIIERLIQVRGIGRWTAEMLCSSIWEGPMSGRCTITECAKASENLSVKENCQRRNRWTRMGESLRRIVPRWAWYVGGRWKTRRRS